MHPMWNGAFTATWRRFSSTEDYRGAMIQRYDLFWEKSNDITGISHYITRFTAINKWKPFQNHSDLASFQFQHFAQICNYISLLPSILPTNWICLSKTSGRCPRKISSWADAACFHGEFLQYAGDIIRKPVFTSVGSIIRKCRFGHFRLCEISKVRPGHTRELVWMRKRWYIYVHFVLNCKRDTSFSWNLQQKWGATSWYL